MDLRIIAVCVALSAVGAGTQAQTLKPVRIAFAGTTSVTAPYAESLKNAGLEAGLSIEVVPRAESGLVARDVYLRTRAGLPISSAPSEGRNYFLIAVSQIGTVANVVIALNREGEVAASVALPGAFYGSGVRDASARELAKKLAALL
jgi:hypothetical protein